MTLKIEFRYKFHFTLTKELRFWGFRIVNLFQCLEEVCVIMISKKQALKQSVAIYVNIAVLGEVW